MSRKRITLTDENSSVTIQAAFDEFIRFCNVRGLSQETITFYEYQYKHFSKFVSPSKPVQSISQNLIYDYVLHLKQSSLKPVSVNTNLRAIRAITNHWKKQEYMSPKIEVKLLKAEKEIKQTYTDAEMQMLLKKPNIKKCPFTEYRDWVMVNWFIATGNRSSSVCDIRIKDVDFYSGSIAVTRTKNKKQQIIPLSNTLAIILQEYLKHRKGKPDDHLFISCYGMPMNRNSVGSSIAKYNRNRGVSKTSVHLFRHTFAKNWILNGGDIFRLQKILGHSDLEIVKEYVSIFGDELKRDFATFNPLDNMVAKTAPKYPSR